MAKKFILGFIAATLLLAGSLAFSQQSTTKVFTITVTAPLSFITVSLPNGSVGVAYSVQLQASGGVAPYTWSLASGSSLPAGLTLDNAGLIHGTPTAEGTTNVTIQVKDSSQ